MRNKILNIFFLALAALLCLCSCGLEDPYGNSQKGNGVIEFVARPVGFNDQVVDTKATVAEGDLETKIYSCYFLVFDTTTGTGNGKLIHSSDNLVTGTTPITSIPPQRLNISKKGVKTVKACFIVNVPQNFIYDEESGAPIINSLASLDEAVLGPTHFSYASHSNDVPMGTPQMTINGASNVKCIPAFGMTSSDINLESGAAAPVQITIKRLFAKVSVNLKVALAGLSDFETAVQTLTHYEVQTLKLYNIPTKVKLLEDTGRQSTWRDVANQYSTSPMQKSGIGARVYNNSENGYSYSFYVPEFYLNPKDGATQQQEFKPKNYPYDDNYKTYPVYVQLEGSFVKYSINSATINYKIFLGGDNIDDFSLARNTHYTNDLTILDTNKNSQDQSNLDHRVTTTTVNNPVSKAGETANCYVISKPGDYHFPAYMGAYKSLDDAIPCEGGDYVKVLANVAQYESDLVDITNINISAEAYDPVTNMISFKVGAVSESISALKNLVPNGNVVIALMDDNNTKGENQTGDDSIIWSWHLWFVSDFSGNESEWAMIGSETYPSGSVMMDRNLGAASATITLLNQSDAIGAYYTYGKKEPFINGAYQGGGSIKDANGNPVAATWSGDSKSPTDPCPPGYRIPQSNDFNGNATKENAPALGAFRYWNNGTTIITTDDIYFPYSGYLDKDKKPQSKGFAQRDTTYNYNRDIPTSQSNLSSINTNYTLYIDAPLRFTNVTYSKYDIVNVGYLRAIDMDLEYGFSEKGIDIISCTVQIGKWEGSGFINRKYTAKYDSSPKTLTGAELESQHELAYNRLLSVLSGKSGSNTDLLGGWLTDIFTQPQHIFKFNNVNNTNGYQVRCVKE